MESGTMLVLSRKLNETIIIGEDIRITVVGTGGNHVRLGIEAPGDVKVMREELLFRDEPRTRNPVAKRHPLAATNTH
jgi:carbon storage regulator